MADYYLSTEDLLYLDSVFTEEKKVNYYASWAYYFSNFVRNNKNSLGLPLSYSYDNKKENIEILYQKLDGKIEISNGNFFNYLKALIRKENYKKLEEYFHQKKGDYIIAKKTLSILTSENLKYINSEDYLKFYQWALKEKYITLTNKSLNDLEIIVNQKTQSKVAILKEMISIFEFYAKNKAWTDKVNSLFEIALKKQKNIPVAEQKRLRKLTDLLDEKYTPSFQSYFSDIEKEEFLSVDASFLNMITINYNTIQNHGQNQSSKTEIKQRVRRQSFHITAVINKEMSHIAKVLTRTEDGSKLIINLVSKDKSNLDLLTEAIYAYLKDITLKTEDREIKDEFPIYFEKLILDKQFSDKEGSKEGGSTSTQVEEKRKNRKI
jgi:hypothetical protein